MSYIVAPGHIRHAAAEPVVMFNHRDNRSSPRVEALRAAFSAAGVHCEIPSDIHKSMWTKFIFITAMSGLGAATRVPVGVWRSMPETRELVVRAIDELIAIAAAHGVSLSESTAQLTMERIDKLAPDATASMQRDVMEGKPSELDAQLGAAVRTAAEKNVPAPVCDFLYRVLLPQEKAARPASSSEFLGVPRSSSGN